MCALRVFGRVPDQVVSETEGKMLARKLNVDYFETSALKNERVEEVLCFVDCPARDPAARAVTLHSLPCCELPRHS